MFGFGKPKKKATKKKPARKSTGTYKIVKNKHYWGYDYEIDHNGRAVGTADTLANARKLVKHFKAGYKP